MKKMVKRPKSSGPRKRAMMMELKKARPRANALPKRTMV
jgi:hypothetical protein